MRRTSLGSLIALAITGLASSACVQSTCSDWGSGCGLADGSICTQAADGGGWNCYVPDGSSGDATTPVDSGVDATLDGAGHDGSIDALADDGSPGNDASVDAGDAGNDAGCGSPTTTDHCGSCEVSCAAPTGGTTACVLGDAGAYVCAPSCTGSLTDCSGACVALTTTAHCGACGTACTNAPDGGEPACIADGGPYQCGFTCQTGEHVCNGGCYPNSDPPSATTDPCVVSPTYGVFVSPTGVNSPGNGTMAAPYLTIAYALSHLGGTTRVYVCGGNYAETITIGANVNLYGGLDCTTTPSQWTYNASHVAIVNPSNGIPLTVGGATTEIDDFTFQSASATIPGGSSIAAFLNAATFYGTRCSFVAGNGMGAVSRAFAPNYTGAAPPGNAPDGGAGGTGGDNLCSLGHSVGGVGGDGAAGADGGTGSASGPTTGEDAGFDGLGGHGGAHSCGAGADPGANGTAGTPVASGATRAGALTSSGWTPQSGQDGTTGNPGQGGGGGGGVVGSAAGGGGGGAGGCGGAGGPGGFGGGSSFALLSYESIVELHSCALSAGTGGAGAAGASGQVGQPGAGGGLSACSGGYGGNGAGGGGGGGGAGGVSATIGYVGTAPVYDSATSSHVSAAGGGLGGGTALGGTGGTADGFPAASGLASTPPGLNGATSTTALNLQ